MLNVGGVPYGYHPDELSVRRDIAEFDEILGKIATEISTSLDAEILAYANIIGYVGEKIWKQTEKTLEAFDEIITQTEEKITTDVATSLAYVIDDFRYFLNSPAVTFQERRPGNATICIGRIDANGKCIGIEIPNPGIPNPGTPGLPGPQPPPQPPGEPGVPFPPGSPGPRPPSPPQPPGGPTPPPKPPSPPPPGDEPPVFPPFPPEPGPDPGPGKPPEPPDEPPSSDDELECKRDKCPVSERQNSLFCPEDDTDVPFPGFNCLKSCAPTPTLRDIRYHAYVPLQLSIGATSPRSECGINAMIGASAIRSDVEIFAKVIIDGTVFNSLGMSYVNPLEKSPLPDPEF